MLAKLWQLFLIMSCSEGVLRQVYASEIKYDRHGDDDTDQLTQQTTAENCSDLWFTPTSGTCHCGSTVYGTVTCNKQTKEVTVLDCYCMTTDSTNQTVVGACIYNCFNLSHNGQYQDNIYHQAPSDCTYLHRSGTLCGECEIDHFPLAYSYNVECIKCTHPDSWWIYIAVAFLPLTIFMVIILVFRIRVVSPKLHAFVFFAQVIALSTNVQIFFLSTKSINPIVSAIVKVYMS